MENKIAIDTLEKNILMRCGSCSLKELRLGTSRLLVRIKNHFFKSNKDWKFLYICRIIRALMSFHTILATRG